MIDYTQDYQPPAWLVRHRQLLDELQVRLKTVSDREERQRLVGETAAKCLADMPREE